MFRVSKYLGIFQYAVSCEIVINTTNSWQAIVNIHWATSRKNVSSEIFDQVRFKPACSATEAN